MKTTVILTFYNEEYLLPWWLKHHREVFDHGIMIDYDSTDDSADIVRDLCPDWTLVKSKNKDFSCYDNDAEMMFYERLIEGPRITLTISEFLIGNFSKITQGFDVTMPQLYMIDDYETSTNWKTRYPDPNTPLTQQRINGISPYESHANFWLKRARFFHSNPKVVYPIGRHAPRYNTREFIIVRFDYSPWNEMLLQRKMQIGPRVPQHEHNRGLQTHHKWTKEMHDNRRADLLPRCTDVGDIIRSYEYWTY